MTALKPVVASMRPPFLILAPICILLGTATALTSQASIDMHILFLALAGGMCAHISVNTLNEYLDFGSGLDRMTRRTPFSGGSGALPAAPTAAGAVLITAVANMVIILLIGLYFIYLRGWLIMPLGLLGLLIILSYTGWINRHPLICLVAPGLGFGPLMVVGTHFVLTGQYAWLPAVVSLVPFFLVNNLLLLNQFPDIDADRRTGRRHWIIRYGTGSGIRAYQLFSLLTAAVLIIAVHQAMIHAASLIALLPLLLVFRIVPGVRNNTDDTPRLVPYLGMNVFMTLATPAMLAAAIFLR